MKTPNCNSLKHSGKDRQDRQHMPATPPGVADGIAIVNRAISAERNKHYDEAKNLYIAAASKILEGSTQYPDGSKERTAARKKATQYADRAEKLSRINQRQQKKKQKEEQQQQQQQQKPPQKSQPASASDIYRVPPSQMYQSAPFARENAGSVNSGSGRHVTSLSGVSSHSVKDDDPNTLSESLLSNEMFTTTNTTTSSATSFLNRRCLIVSTAIFVVGALVALLVVALIGGRPDAPSPSGTSPTPGSGLSPSSAADLPCGPGPKWQVWNGMVDKSAWYDYIDVNVPVSKRPTSGVMSNGESVELEIDTDMGGTSKRSSQLYANPEFQKYYDDLIREWNPSASTRTGTVDSCGFPKGDKADTSTPELEDFKRETCMYEDFNQGLILEKLRPLEQKACCEQGPPESGVGCWKWSNGTTYPKGCSTSGGGYKFNGNIGVEEMSVEYPHNSNPKRKNVLRLTSRNDDASICSDPFTTPADKKKLCHKVLKSSGLVQTNDMYGSARFEVIAKVPADRGLVWALWTFHQELHVPGKLGCEDYSCYADGFPGGTLGNETGMSNLLSEDTSDDKYMFTPRTMWDDCCDTVHCCLDPTPPTESKMFLRAMQADQCYIPQSKRVSNSTCQCCSYNLDNNQYPHHKYNAPCCIASKQKIGPCTGPNLCDKDYYTDARSTKCSYGKDPQWLRNASMVSWLNKINHEIDIEIPASCYDSEVCGVSAGQCGLDIEDGKWCNTTLRDSTGCVRQFNTMNANNYRLTTSGGTGHAYSNMCLKAHKKKKQVVGSTHGKASTTTTEGEGEEEREPFMLAGDGKFHKYTIDWHTGGPNCEARVDFYVDDVLLTTNNVMVPTRGSRFVFGSWGPEKGAATSASGKFNNEWTNFPDFWGNGKPGDGKSYLSHVYVSEVKITPHNEPNDIMYPATLDRKDGCDKIFGQEKRSCHQHWETDKELGWKDQRIPPAVAVENEQTYGLDSCTN